MRTIGSSIIIVGAGMGGLASGIYGRMKGYRTTILSNIRNPAGSAPPGSARATLSMDVSTISSDATGQ